MNRKQNLCLCLAWLVALTATLITLFDSLMLHHAACELCWYQRIFLYPLSIILGIGIYRNDKSVSLYCLPLAAIGFLIACYHYALQMWPQFFPIHTCNSSIPCQSITFIWAGFITYPFLSAVSFLAIITLLILQIKNK